MNICKKNSIILIMFKYNVVLQDNSINERIKKRIEKVRLRKGYYIFISHQFSNRQLLVEKEKKQLWRFSSWVDKNTWWQCCKGKYVRARNLDSYGASLLAGVIIPSIASHIVRAAFFSLIMQFSLICETSRSIGFVFTRITSTWASESKKKTYRRCTFVHISALCRAHS